MLKYFLLTATVASLIVFSVSDSTAETCNGVRSENTTSITAIKEYLSENCYGDNETEIMIRFSDACNKLTMKRLYQRGRTQAGKKHVTSLAPVLRMLTLAIIFETGSLQKENMDLLQVSSADEAKTALSIFDEMVLTNNTNYFTSIAMKVFGDSNNCYSEKFESQSECIGIPTEYVNYSSPTEAAVEMSSWVRDVTSYEITNIMTEELVNSKSSAIVLGSSTLTTYWNEKLDVKDAGNMTFHVSKNENATVPFLKISGAMRVGKCEALNATVITIPLAGSCERKVFWAENGGNDFLNTLYTLENSGKFDDMMSLGETQNINLYMPNDTYLTGREHYAAAMKLSGNSYDLMVPNECNVCDGVFKDSSSCGYLSIMMHQLELSIKSKPAETADRRRRDTTDTVTTDCSSDSTDTTDYTTFNITKSYASVVVCHGITYFATLYLGPA